MSSTVRGMVKMCGGAGSVVVEWNLDGRREEGTGRKKKKPLVMHRGGDVGSKRRRHCVPRGWQHSAAQMGGSPEGCGRDQGMWPRLPSLVLTVSTCERDRPEYDV